MSICQMSRQISGRQIVIFLSGSLPFEEANVEFFSQRYKRLGDKDSLRLQIHAITGIPERALEGEPLSHFSVNDRLSWMEKRQTKYEEDKVYSLLGIFGVYISPFYGEGMARALTRLQDEIKKLEECNPGKGKTILLYGIINELSKSTAKITLLSYFFNQATNSRINSTTAVLRGLLFMLINQQLVLISHLRKKHN
ncbi:hypothetical protein CC78DRAFT_587585 [Lojkania enalia]|uniref:Nephrocystin 3-like N-terminal domain-containing protein n=1 Tax=Lojkania enalia TaxID=147567 RepID=A0A9P4MUN7_9PLEO|nr:hypothetical protein CC78DRAFT_587585 [Didymosphaeria enalia]